MAFAGVTDGPGTRLSTTNTVPRTLHLPAVMDNEPGWSLSTYSPINLFQHVVKPTRSQTCHSYWSALNPQQKQGCVDVGRKRLFGVQTGWWPAGCILQRWEDELFPTIRRIQNEEGNNKKIFKGQRRHPVCMMELWMIEDGGGIHSVLPTIVARCSYMKIAKRTLSVLWKIHSFVDLNLGFGSLPWQEELGLVGGPERTQPLMERSVLPGGSTPLLPLNTWNRATLGGVLLLNKEYYGLTVAHAFYDENEGTSQEDDAEFQSDEESDLDSDSDGFQAQSKHLADEDGHHHSPTSRAPDKNIVYAGQFEQGLPTAAFTAAEVPSFIAHLSLVGYLPHRHDNSHPPIRRTEVPGPAKWISSQSDWALVRIYDPRFFGPNRFITPEGETIVPSRTSSSPPKGNVFLASSNSQLRKAYCPGIKSGIFLPNSTEMQETWALDIQCCKWA